MIVEPRTYPKDLLYKIGRPGPKKGRYLDEVAFPLGGIGTGTISLSGYGELLDWEIQNRPNKGSFNAFSFFTLWAKEDGKDPVTKVLAERPMRGLGGVGSGLFSGIGFGTNRFLGRGLPHMKSATFRGEYPFAEIKFGDPEVPLDVRLTAYNPLIPHNVKDSSIPCAIFLFELKNRSDRKVSATILVNMHNIVDGDFTNYNEYVETDGVRGIYMSSHKEKPESPKWGSMGLFTRHGDVTYTRAWVRGAWYDNLTNFWEEVSKTGEVIDRDYPPMVGDIATLGMKAEILPGEKIVLPLYITWSFPVMEGYFCPDMTEEAPDGTKTTGKPRWKNYYAKMFPDALSAAAYLSQNHERLYDETRSFHEALFSSTLPDYVIDAVSSQISTIRSPTCILLEDGTFYSFEGCHSGEGCCEGSCTHVWNYAQTLAFLFPSLERSMREAEYRYNLMDDGRMSFRTSVPLGVKLDESALGGTAGLGEVFHPAADGQMGGIMRIYRDFMLSGDEEFLRSLWPSVKKSLEYAWKFWDADKDGMMEGLQHNTYDIEFYGPNTMMGGLYVGALRAASEMAEYLGEDKKASEYRELSERGARLMDEELFNGHYYIQKVDPDAERLSPVPTDVSMSGSVISETGPKYQYGEGCLSDQLFGEALAGIFGLGRLFDRENVKSALLSIFKNNWRMDLSGHANPQRVFAVEGEPGLVLCTWPRGKRPLNPFVYSDEVWTGIEYQVAAHLICEGFVDEGLSIARGVRERYDGRYRNPFNEIECGSHYVRALASWGLILALSGFRFYAPNKTYGFFPKIQEEDFKTFWSTASGWGTFSQKIESKTSDAILKVLYGSLEIERLLLSVRVGRKGAKVFKGKEEIGAKIEDFDGGVAVKLDTPQILKGGDFLRIKI